MSLYTDERPLSSNQIVNRQQDPSFSTRKMKSPYGAPQYEAENSKPFEGNKALLPNGYEQNQTGNAARYQGRLATEEIRGIRDGTQVEQQQGKQKYGGMNDTRKLSRENPYAGNNQEISENQRFQYKNPQQYTYQNIGERNQDPQFNDNEVNKIDPRFRDTRVGDLIKEEISQRPIGKYGDAGDKYRDFYKNEQRGVHPESGGQRIQQRGDLRQLEKDKFDPRVPDRFERELLQQQPEKRAFEKNGQREIYNYDERKFEPQTFDRFNRNPDKDNPRGIDQYQRVRDPRMDEIYAKFDERGDPRTANQRNPDPRMGIYKQEDLRSDPKQGMPEFRNGDRIGDPTRMSDYARMGVPRMGDPVRMGDQARGDPRMGDPRMADPRMGDPRMGDPRMGDPRMGDPRAGDPRMGDPRAGDLRMGDPRMGDPRMADPRMGDPVRMGDQARGDPRMGDPRMGDPRMGDPRMADQRTITDPRMGDPRQITDPRMGEFRLGQGPNRSDPRLEDPRMGALMRNRDARMGDPRREEIRTADVIRGDNNPRLMRRFEEEPRFAEREVNPQRGEYRFEERGNREMDPRELRARMQDPRQNEVRYGDKRDFIKTGFDDLRREEKREYQIEGLKNMKGDKRRFEDNRFGQELNRPLRRHPDLDQKYQQRTPNERKEFELPGYKRMYEQRDGKELVKYNYTQNERRMEEKSVMDRFGLDKDSRRGHQREELRGNNLSMIGMERNSFGGSRLGERGQSQIKGGFQRTAYQDFGQRGSRTPINERLTNISKQDDGINIYNKQEMGMKKPYNYTKEGDRRLHSATSDKNILRRMDN